MYWTINKQVCAQYGIAANIAHTVPKTGKASDKQTEENIYVYPIT